MMRVNDQELLRLWAWEELTPGQIAAVLGTTPNAVSIRLHRARGRLANLLQAQRKEVDVAGQERAEEGGLR